MQAIIIESGRIGVRHDFPPPTPTEDEVLVRVRQAGVCETDLQLARGYMNFHGVPGHEFVGVAEAGTLAGQRVVGEINCNCRQCPRCDAGLGNHCDRRTVLGIDRHDGAFAEWVAVPHHNLHPIPDSISDDQAVLVEPLAAAFQIVQQVPLDDVRNAVVLGDGRLAWFCAQVLRGRVDRIEVVGKHAAKLARFSDRDIDTLRLDQCPKDRSRDLVVDCTGSASGLPLALELVRPRGTVVMKTTIAAPHELSLAPVVINEIQLIGSRCGPFDLAIDALGDGTVDVDGLITHRFPLSQATDAFATATLPDAFKVVLVP